MARKKVCVNLTKSGIGIAILSKIMQPTETTLIIVFIVQENARWSIKEKKQENWSGPEKESQGVKLEVGVMGGMYTLQWGGERIHRYHMPELTGFFTPTCCLPLCHCQSSSPRSRIEILQTTGTSPSPWPCI